MLLEPFDFKHSVASEIERIQSISAKEVRSSKFTGGSIRADECVRSIVLPLSSINLLLGLISRINDVIALCPRPL
jgi:hypothetical protein